MGNEAYFKRLRVAGNVCQVPIKRSGTRVDFMLKENELTLPVSYTGTKLLPILSRRFAGFADGSFERRVFHAKQLQASAPRSMRRNRSRSGS